MAVSVTLQCYVFLVMCVIGVVIGAAFDVLRVVQMHIKTNTVIIALTDALFWIAVTFVVLYTVFWVNSGEIRWFEFLALALGGIIYFNTVSRLFIKIIRSVSDFIIKAAKKTVMFFVKFKRT